MSKQVVTNAYLSIGGTDVSASLKSVSITRTADGVDVTTMNAGGDRSRLAGLKDWSLSAEFLNDFAAAALNSILFPLVGTSVAIEWRATNAVVSASNPKLSGTMVVTSFSPIGQSVGDAVAAPLQGVGSGALTLATA